MVDQVELVERVARALFDREWNASDVAVRNEVWVDDEQRAYFAESARAALEASHHAELEYALAEFGCLVSDFALAAPNTTTVQITLGMCRRAKALVAKIRGKGPHPNNTGEV